MSRTWDHVQKYQQSYWSHTLPTSFCIHLNKYINQLIPAYKWVMTQIMTNRAGEAQMVIFVFLHYFPNVARVKESRDTSLSHFTHRNKPCDRNRIIGVKSNHQSELLTTYVWVTHELTTHVVCSSSEWVTHDIGYLHTTYVVSYSLWWRTHDICREFVSNSLTHVMYICREFVSNSLSYVMYICRVTYIRPMSWGTHDICMTSSRHNRIKIESYVHMGHRI